MRNDFCGMTFEAFASQIMSLNKHESANKNQINSKNDFKQKME